MLTSEAVSSAAGLATGIDLLEPLGLFLRAQKQRSWAGKNIVSHRRANVMEKSKESHVLGAGLFFLACLQIFCTVKVLVFSRTHDRGMQGECGL
jgi:hypothetical protein